MGTNYYVRGQCRINDMDPDTHIGKRSAAGPYCWDCGVTLCKGGEAHVHMGKSGWLKACPKCGKSQEDESIKESSVGRELGFNKIPPQRKTGVKSCSSFSWAMKRERFEELKESKAGKCPCCGTTYADQDKIIENEYGDLFTLEEFEQILQECPIQYTESIGQCFC